MSNPSGQSDSPPAGERTQGKVRIMRLSQRGPFYLVAENRRIAVFPVDCECGQNELSGRANIDFTAEAFDVAWEFHLTPRQIIDRLIHLENQAARVALKLDLMATEVEEVSKKASLKELGTILRAAMRDPRRSHRTDE